MQRDFTIILQHCLACSSDRSAPTSWVMRGLTEHLTRQLATHLNKQSACLIASSSSSRSTMTLCGYDVTALAELGSTYTGTRLHCGHVGFPGVVLSVSCRRHRRTSAACVPMCGLMAGTNSLLNRKRSLSLNPSADRSKND